jgi:hypothetical protein
VVEDTIPWELKKKLQAKSVVEERKAISNE